MGQIQTWSCLKIEVCKSPLSIIWQNLFFGLHVDFQSKISKEQVSNNLSFSSCVSRYSSPAPNPPTSNQLANHYCTMWLDGVKVLDPRPDKSTPKKYIDNVWQNGLSQNKSLHKGGQVPLQKMLESYKNEGISTISPIKRTLEKHRDTYKSRFFFGSPVKIHSFSFRSSVWLPHDLTAIPLPCCLITLHTLV